MAVERRKEFILDLSGVVNQKLQNLQVAVLQKRFTNESSFQERVLEDNLSLEAQK